MLDETGIKIISISLVGPSPGTVKGWLTALAVTNGGRVDCFLISIVAVFVICSDHNETLPRASL